MTFLLLLPGGVCKSWSHNLHFDQDLEKALASAWPRGTTGQDHALIAIPTSRKIPCS